MAAAYPQVLISQRTLFQLEADYIQALENAWQNCDSGLWINGRAFGAINPSIRGAQRAPVGTGTASYHPTAAQ